MKIKILLAGLLLAATAAFGQSQFSGGVNGQGITIGAGSSTFTKGQLLSGVGLTSGKPSPFGILVSSYCGDATGATCPNFLGPGGQGDPCIAVNQIISDYSCTLASARSCHIIFDMTGLQSCSQSPTSGANGQMDFFTNGPALDLRLDGMDTYVLGKSFQIHGMGGSSSDQIAQNTRFIACNPATDNCFNAGSNANGSTGFNVQNTSATTITYVLSGANPNAILTVTLAAGAPFSVSETALNSIGSVANPRKGRTICIYGATGGANGCHLLKSVTTAGAPQVFVLTADSAIDATCSVQPCGTASLTTPVIAIHDANNGGVFHTRLGNLVIDGHDLPGVEGLVNDSGEEGTGTDGSIQIYNTPSDGLRLEESSAYAGNCSATCGNFTGIGVANHGPYGSITVNFNPFIVTKGGSGAACNNSGVDTCVGGFVAAGSRITMSPNPGVNVATMSNPPLPNPNFVGVVITGVAGNQGGGPLMRLTVSDQDKAQNGVNQGIFVANGASTPAGGIFIGQGNFGIINSHVEFLPMAFNICGDANRLVEWTQVYGGIPTYGVTFDTGKWDFWPAAGFIGLDVGTTGGTQANCQEIDVRAVTFGFSGSGNILSDNLLGKTIAGSSTIQSLNFHHGQGSAIANLPWSSSNTSVGIGNWITNLTNPMRDVGGRFELAASMAASSGTVGLGTTGGGNTTFSWPVTTGFNYDIQCSLPTSLAVASSTVRFSLYSVSGPVTVSFGSIQSRGDTGAASAFQELSTIGAASIAAMVTPVTGAPGASAMITVNGQFTVSASGNIGIEFIGNGVNNVTMLQGGECTLTQTN